ncbi:carbamoyl-phosphate synthase large subunit [Streptoalloteichus tenebrarius]|uniref:Carbamoyl-phosphate synthase large subunit n=1 Tax=Streptoalloteichus tenebrarius (strain ATCC 17920 / DSM 40477 / JCM 4838 / CBS 697.72 / NBRC 16177 / NCIMB 11028 / NRRL B-12390 / A12253. 1 / ISP 5477) TaxID=1933 RepID=A0ABT1I0A4_STRSD|nr:ATP-grasp domain-containing protein [Streptoalloteichus tenebrarius]MCP2261216.1 carbamoyl-phosphate synthase large subunit [Streptoalloteichus tenebrarius]BFF04408.1 ATP-grasp domain-containing protein [Streptoalloteichus tenebrarius]
MTSAAPLRRILVTGVGGAPGFDLARSLLRLGLTVIAADAHPLAPGLALPGVTPRTIPPATDPCFGPHLLELCRHLRPEALISTVEAELPHLVAMREVLAEVGVRTWLPTAEAVRVCADKAAFAALLAAHGIPTPRTGLPDQLHDLPEDTGLVVKPRRGHGAQGVRFCRSRAQARVLCGLVPDPVVQERVAGREWTADCLVDAQGRASVVPRWRLLVKGGLAMVSTTFHDPEVVALATATLAAVGVVGPCCVQGFVRDPGTPRVVVTEVNARFAGGFPAAQAAGADLVLQTLRGLAGHGVDHDRLRYQPGIRLTKYVETLLAGPDPDLPTPPPLS